MNIIVIDKKRLVKCPLFDPLNMVLIKQGVTRPHEPALIITQFIPKWVQGIWCGWLFGVQGDCNNNQRWSRQGISDSKILQHIWYVGKRIGEYELGDKWETVIHLCHKCGTKKSEPPMGVEPHNLPGECFMKPLSYKGTCGKLGFFMVGPCVMCQNIVYDQARHEFPAAQWFRASAWRMEGDKFNSLQGVRFSLSHTCDVAE